MENAKLSPPWWEFYHKMEAMFDRDPDIHLSFDENEMKIKIFVDNQTKVDALNQVLPSKREFGNVVLNIDIIPSDKVGNYEQIFRTIFNGNPVFSNAVEIEGPGMPNMSYVIFKPLIVQFYNDNMADANGNLTALYQDIAKDIFVTKDGLHFCTESIRPVSK